MPTRLAITDMSVSLFMSLSDSMTVSVSVSMSVSVSVSVKESAGPYVCYIAGLRFGGLLWVERRAHIAGHAMTIREELSLGVQMGCHLITTWCLERQSVLAQISARRSPSHGRQCPSIAFSYAQNPCPEGYRPRKGSAASPQLFVGPLKSFSGYGPAAEKPRTLDGGRCFKPFGKRIGAEC